MSSSVRRFKMYQNRCIAALAQKYTDFYFELLPEIEFDEEEIRQLTEENVEDDGNLRWDKGAARKIKH